MSTASRSKSAGSALGFGGVSAKASAAALDGKQRMREDTRGRFWRRKAVIARELDVSYPLVDDPS